MKKLVDLDQCCVLTGLHLEAELPEPHCFSNRHQRLYRHYLLDYEESWEDICQLIVSKIKSSLEQHAVNKAADHLIVLRRLLWDFLGPRALDHGTA